MWAIQRATCHMPSGFFDGCCYHWMRTGCHSFGYHCMRDIQRTTFSSHALASHGLQLSLVNHTIIKQQGL
ncbi:predicted protein [Lichtheimia corymbifera JMRC:FSU:9682]|uniref:Uncharacterized protein n=1 Tax=Lichtheimia corymbifera JMRC:FSU:9682 TaxID=1263082 RepID=A0A068SBX9_9FUNG|nr:predicted protein [Lichtheimia corymbifera JMRC:FSU:9682]